jgi:transposase
MPNKEIIPILKEILKWTKFNTMRLRDILSEELKTKEDKLIYEYSNGERSMREVGRLAGVSHATVQKCWNRWVQLGIIEPVEKYRGGRCRKLCSLKELGIAPTSPQKSIVPKKKGG